MFRVCRNVPPAYIWMPKRQTGFVFCVLFLERQVSGSAFDLQPLFFPPQFIWLSAFVCGPHYNTDIKYTSKLLKLNKIKCAACHRRCALIEHIYICRLTSPSAVNFPYFTYLNVLRYSYRAALQKLPYSVFADAEPKLF